MKCTRFVSQGVSASVAALCLLFALATGVSAAARKPLPLGVSSHLERTAEGACRVAGGSSCTVRNFERLPVVGDVVHYRFEVRIGRGPFDVIRIHRVVKERRPFAPVPTRHALFALHGSAAGFEASFLPNLGVTAPAQAMPVYLAQRGVDVWGVDLGWILVPADTTDFSGFADWGFDKEARQSRMGLAIARALRAATSGDGGPMTLLGWSYGAQVGYVLVAEESQLPARRRHVKGFVPVDMAMKYEPGTIPDWVCGYAAYYQELQDSGQYGDGGIGFYSYVGNLALEDPLGESPISPPLNNYQAALQIGAGAGGLTPTFHMVAGTFDAEGVATGFQFAQPDVFLAGLAASSSWAPVLAGLDQLNIWCDEADVPFDDHLGDVHVPVLYLGAAGGYGRDGIYSTTLLGSRDVTTVVVSQRPPGEEALDFGHWDLFIADNAASLAWKPILDWLRKH